MRIYPHLDADWSRERAGRRVMTSLTDFIEGRLRLKVNQAKSAVALPEERHFVGFRLRLDPRPIDAHIRRRLRAIILRHWKRRRTIAKRLVKLGVNRRAAWKQGGAVVPCDPELDLLRYLGAERVGDFLETLDAHPGVLGRLPALNLLLRDAEPVSEALLSDARRDAGFDDRQGRTHRES